MLSLVGGSAGAWSVESSKFSRRMTILLLFSVGGTLNDDLLPVTASPASTAKGRSLEVVFVEVLGVVVVMEVVMRGVIVVMDGVMDGGMS